jgi:hypothetical protein
MIIFGQLSEPMTTWVGLFVSNLDGKTIRELEVEADDEETAIVMLDFYEYDDTWQQYSFVGIHQKRWNWLTALFSACKKLLFINISFKKNLGEKVGEKF